MHPRPPVRLRRLPSAICVVVLFVFALIGCGADEGRLLHSVQGRIRLDGRLLTAGSVSLRPEVSGAWYQPTGLIEPEGTYTIFTDRRAGAPAGSYRVVVFANELASSAPGTAAPGMPKSLISTRYHRPETTPLRLNVVPSPAAGAYDLELNADAK